MTRNRNLPTPWQRVYSKFGLSQSEFAREFGCHRSKISRVLSDGEGLIGGPDQKRLFKIARKLNVVLTADDLIPEQPQ